VPIAVPIALAKIHIPVFSDAPVTLVIGVLVIAGIGIGLLAVEKGVTGQRRHGGTIAVVTAALMAAWILLYHAITDIITGFNQQPAPRASIPKDPGALVPALIPPDAHITALTVQPWMYLALLGCSAVGALLVWFGLHNLAERPAVFLTGVALLVASAFAWFVILIPNTV
jgi:hypothetical protein